MPPPATTAHGALLAHITGGHVEPDAREAGGARSYQPMNVNFGLFPPLALAPKDENGQRLRGTEKTLAKKRALSRRALAELERWIAADAHVVAAE
jgi:methylenetetrahydrofolate--tRNA-(uracil-5-)-methyltransferase